jgi:hypothetical protein
MSYVARILLVETREESTLLPTRRRMPSQEVVLGDEDIIESVPIAPSNFPRSRTHSAVVPRLGNLRRLPRLNAIPRLDGLPEMVEPTKISDVAEGLAGLSDPFAYPRLLQLAPVAELVGHEAVVASLVEANMNVESILRMSPMSDDETLRILARLVANDVITLERPSSRPPYMYRDDRSRQGTTRVHQ